MERIKLTVYTEKFYRQTTDDFDRWVRLFKRQSPLSFLPETSLLIKYFLAKRRKTSPLVGDFNRQKIKAIIDSYKKRLKPSLESKPLPELKLFVIDQEG